jgi:hypothetical protein
MEIARSKLFISSKNGATEVKGSVVVASTSPQASKKT